MSRWVESVERVIPASPERIFALVADPRRHQDISGDETVRDAVKAPDQLHVGATFTLNMEFGGPYRMVSTVIEYEPNRRVAWQSRPPLDGRTVAADLRRSDLALRAGAGRRWDPGARELGRLRGGTAGHALGRALVPA